VFPELLKICFPAESKQLRPAQHQLEALPLVVELWLADTEVAI
jgi:hypothetical protein